jgi:predicted outer membrane repeat protein
LLLVLALDVAAEDAVVGTGTPASCTESTFNAALALVVNDTQGGTLTFNCGPDPDVILLSSVKNLTGFVTIDGGGKMTLDGQDSTRLFNINPQPNPEDATLVTLRNIDLNRGNSGAEPFGGALLVNAGTQMDLDHVSIRNSLASISGGAIAAFADVSLNIANSSFVNNLAANGGAIATRAVVNVTNTSFVNNNASGGEGGAIQSYEQNLRITDSSFSGNGARFGGAVFKGNAQAEIRSSTFSNNSSLDDGGAIHARIDAFLGTFDSDFRGNSAGRDGGAVFARSIYSSDRSIYAQNSARSGGAIRLDGGVLALERSTLDRNTATMEGGAISAFATLVNFGENPALRHVTSSGNTTTTGSGGDLAFSASNGLTALIENVTLMGASASSGGSTIHLSGNIRLDVSRSLLWARAGTTCVTADTTSIVTLGSNIGGLGCSLGHGADAISSTFAGFGLGEFANYGGRVDTYLPLPGSAAIDRGGTFCLSDARGRPAPVDGDGSGSVLCDAGAVERQLQEPPPALFRNGFESEL